MQWPRSFCRVRVSREWRGRKVEKGRKLANNERKNSEIKGRKVLDLFLGSRFIYILIFLCSFFIYNLNFREVSELDTYPTRFLPISILKEFDLDLDEFFILHYDKKEQSELPYYIRYDPEKEHYYSRYSPLPALFALPVYVLPVYAGWLDEAEPDYAYDVSFVSKIASSLLASLSVVFFFAAVKLVTRVRLAMVTTGVYAFATGMWSVAAQGLWQHTPAVFCLSLGLYFLLRSCACTAKLTANRRSGSSLTPSGLAQGRASLRRLQGSEAAIGLIYSSLFLSLAVGLRPSNIFLLLAAWVYLLFSRAGWRRIFIFCLLPLLIGALTIYFNLKTTGSYLGGCGGIEGFPLKTHRVESIWQVPSGKSFLGLLLSPNRGLFVYSPVLIFSLLGMVRVWRRGGVSSGLSRPQAGKQGRWLFRFLSVAIWATVVLYSAGGIWWGGWSFGPRYMTDLLPFFSLFVAVGLAGVFDPERSAINVRLFMRGLFLVAFFYSVFVQAVGFFAYPSGWNSLPDNVDLVHERLWDFGDTQIIRCIKAGKRPSIFAQKSLAHTERALNFFNEKRYDEAIAQNLEAIRLYRENPFAHNNLASIYFTLNRWDEALEEYNKALEINPNIFVAWKNLGIIHRSRGKAAAARLALSNALMLQPENYEVRKMLEELEHETHEINEKHEKDLE